MMTLEEGEGAREKAEAKRRKQSAYNKMKRNEEGRWLKPMK